MNTDTTIDEYLAALPQEVQQTLQQLRVFIHDQVPGYGEKMAYGIPTITLNGNLVHFAGYKNHIGFYPGSSAIEHFAPELTGYHLSKGTIQFTLDKPLPYDLIGRIVKYCVQQNMEKKTSKK